MTDNAVLFDICKGQVQRNSKEMRSFMIHE